MAVYAVATDGSRYLYTEVAYYNYPLGDANAYRLTAVVPGDYFVFSVTRETTSWDPRGSSSPHFGAAYTKAVLCGLTLACTDHSVVPVHVGQGETVSGIDPGDWYTPASTYPLVPGDKPWAISTVSNPWYSTKPSDGFPDATSVAQHLLGWDAKLVDSAGGCEANRACAWLTGQHDGLSASYVTAQTGTNGLFRVCTVYTTRDSAGSHLLDANCRRQAESFPGVGSTGQLAYNGKSESEPSCVKFHANPDLTSGVLACLPIKASITIDQGPSYVAQASPDPSDLTLNYWWHVAGEGWVVHHYVMWSV